MMSSLDITSPLDTETIAKLRAGDLVSLSGVVYTARDAAHARLTAAIRCKQPLPFDPAGQTIYYMGPSPTPPGHIIGACGPTTSSRMDPFTPMMLRAGIKTLLGKGARTAAIKETIIEHRAVYLVTYGGAGALLAKTVRHVAVASYPELGAEAVLRLEVTSLPAIVAYDIYGGDLFANEIPKYARQQD